MPEHLLTQGGPRVWSRGDVYTLMQFLNVGTSADQFELMKMMEFVESFADAGHKPAQPRDSHGRFASMKPHLEAVG